MTKKGKVFILLLTIACGTGVLHYATGAYMTDTHTVENTLEFVGEEGLKAELSEPSWEPEKGLLVVPGRIVQKDPQVTNISEVDMNGLVALRVDFVYTDSCPANRQAGDVLEKEDMERISKVFDIDYNADKVKTARWVRFTGESAACASQCFYYKETLKRNFPEKGDTTIPLFTRVEVKKEAGNQEIAAVREIGGVEIRITGIVLQQMNGESYLGLNSAKEAYEAGLFEDLKIQKEEA